MSHPAPSPALSPAPSPQCETVGGKVFCFAWIVIHDKLGNEGLAKTATFALPAAVADLV